MNDILISNIVGFDKFVVYLMVYLVLDSTRVQPNTASYFKDGCVSDQIEILRMVLSLWIHSNLIATSADNEQTGTTK